MSFALGVVLLGVGASSASADIFTRRNEQGILEATDRPAAGEGFKLAYRSKGVVIHSAAFRAAPPHAARFEPFIQEAAAREGISPDLVRAVIRTESAFDQLAVSSAGARGLMQLMPDAARRFGVQNVFDAQDNIQGGVRYLRVLLKMFGGDVALAVAAYNAGEGAVTRHRGVPPYRETRQYVQKILGLLSMGAAPPAVMMASYTPGDGRSADPSNAISPAAAAPARAAAVAPRQKPRTLYRWRDANGVHHMSETPPSGPVDFTTIRSTD